MPPRPTPTSDGARVTHGPEHTPHDARPLVEGTGRLEAFSDGVFEIVVTLLIIEVHLPPLVGSGSQAMLDALGEIAPKLVSFTVSFATVAIYWVNHHHFFSRVTHTDWKLLWANNLLLFWLTVVPFTTAVARPPDRARGRLHLRRQSGPCGRVLRTDGLVRVLQGRPRPGHRHLCRTSSRVAEGDQGCGLVDFGAG